MAVAETPTSLDPLDFLAIDALLDEEERAIRDTVRTFVRERVLPEVGDWFEQGILPRELMAELGYFLSSEEHSARALVEQAQGVERREAARVVPAVGAHVPPCRRRTARTTPR